jgi:hypothetical protein
MRYNSNISPRIEKVVLTGIRVARTSGYAHARGRPFDPGVYRETAGIFRAGSAPNVGPIDGGAIGSDGSGLLLGEVEARTGIIARLAE